MEPAQKELSKNKGKAVLEEGSQGNEINCNTKRKRDDEPGEHSLPVEASPSGSKREKLDLPTNSSLRTMSQRVTLRSSDGVSFEVDIAVATQSDTIRKMFEDNCAGALIPLPNVTAKILAKVIEYCKRHIALPDLNDPDPDKSLKSFDAEFVNLDKETLFQLILAANYMDIKSLYALTLQTVADNMIKNKTPEEIREKLNLENDFTPEEEQQIRQKHRWISKEEQRIPRRPPRWF